MGTERIACTPARKGAIGTVRQHFFGEPRAWCGPLSTNWTAPCALVKFLGMDVQPLDRGQDELARALLDWLDDRQARIGRAPRRPSERIEQRRNPLPALAGELAQAISEEWQGDFRPSERAEIRAEVEAPLRRLLAV